MDKQDRADKINQLVKVIGDGGRNFFKHKERYAKIEIDDRGKIWWVDDYSEKRIYTHYENGRWKGFTHGGTLRDLVIAFRDFVSKGTVVPSYHFGPWLAGAIIYLHCTGRIPDAYCNKSTAIEDMKKYAV